MTVVAVGVQGQIMGALLGADKITDPSNARTIYLAAGGLVVLAIAVAAGTVWWWRSSKVEHPALGPLEVMGTRSWWKGDYAARRRRLAAARPVGAEPDPSLAVEAPEQIDLWAAASAPPRQFDDLLEEPREADAVPAPEEHEAPEEPEVTEVTEVTEATEEPEATDAVAAPDVVGVASLVASGTDQETAAGPAGDISDESSAAAADSTPAEPANTPIVISTAAAPAAQGSIVVSSSPKPVVTPAPETVAERRAPIDPLLRQAPSE